MTKSKNRSWIKQHVKDPFVKQSQADGYRSRASYKLLEIIQKDRLIRSGMTVVDLGSAPGGWSQVAAKYVGHQGRVHGIDLLPMDPIAGVDFVEGDFTEDKPFNELLDLIENRTVDLVISDMAPNISGIKSADQAGIIYLNELALQFAVDWLKPKGNFLVKSFIGAEFDDYVREVKKYFETVYTFKPKSSRNRSSEIFVYGKSKI